ncbi:MAG: PTS system mannose/fructose/sorbose family transporter subunit IID [Clostridiales bacterium]|jgi:PTS system mannose-specific IID component|nr:PTS system mannose/fructose/sorbose family transporter subunit IID [Clostridiales bacterium]
MARTNKKLSPETIRKAAWRHAWTLQWCWNYERMQASGVAYTMVPVMKELYTDNDEICENLERHMQFYNSHPGTSAAVIGAAVALEQDYQPEMADSIKIALMGPMASLGDTIQGVLIQPMAYTIAAGLASEGSFMALPVVIIPLLLLFLARWPLFSWGYNRSVNIIQDVSGASTFNDLRDAASILGITVIGGFVPSMINTKFRDIPYGTIVNDAGEVVPNLINVQGALDSFLPRLLPIALVAFCYWLLKSKKQKPINVILILAVVAFVLGAAGIWG